MNGSELWNSIWLAGRVVVKNKTDCFQFCRSTAFTVAGSLALRKVFENFEITEFIGAIKCLSKHLFCQHKSMPSVSYSASSSPEVDDSFVMKRVV